MRKTKVIVYFRRKREGRTDYRKRLALLKSRLPRLVIRKSNKHIMVQLVEYSPDGDHVKVTAKSSELSKQGWKGATGNIPAAYLTGMLLAKKAAKIGADKSRVIVDIGMNMHKSGSRIYGAVKGAKDGGLDVACSEEIFPSEQRIAGEHCNVKDFASIKKKIEGFHG